MFATRDGNLVNIDKKAGLVLSIFAVAPLAGAWIEIKSVFELDIVNRSLPSRERGLKLISSVAEEISSLVAPLAGAWIEIFNTAVIESVMVRRSPRGSVD